jgi:uncharacterized membrane protein
MSAVTAKDRDPASNTQALDSSFAASAVWAVSATLAVAILAAIIAAPLLQSSGHPLFATNIYSAFSFVCHQIPERSFHLFGNKFAVCSRCTGIYAGIGLAVLAYPLTRSLKQTATPRLVWLFLAAAPLAVDWSLGYFSIWQNNHASRFGTGFLLGAACVFYILPGLIELSSKVIFRRREREV